MPSVRGCFRCCCAPRARRPRRGRHDTSLAPPPTAAVDGEDVETVKGFDAAGGDPLVVLHRDDLDFQAEDLGMVDDPLLEVVALL